MHIGFLGSSGPQSLVAYLGHPAMDIVFCFKADVLSVETNLASVFQTVPDI